MIQKVSYHILQLSLGGFGGADVLCNKGVNLDIESDRIILTCPSSTEIDYTGIEIAFKPSAFMYKEFCRGQDIVEFIGWLKEKKLEVEECEDCVYLDKLKVAFED